MCMSCKSLAFRILCIPYKGLAGISQNIILHSLRYDLIFYAVNGNVPSCSHNQLSLSKRIFNLELFWLYIWAIWPDLQLGRCVHLGNSRIWE